MASQISKQTVFDFLQQNFIMEIATCSNNKPAASVVMYAIDKDWKFYFGTHKDSFKAQNLRQNPSISIAIWKHNQMMVQSDGTTHEITDTDRTFEVMDMMAVSAEKGENFWPPLFRIQGNEYAFFMIEPHWLRALDLTRNTLRQESSPFIEINLQS